MASSEPLLEPSPGHTSLPFLCHESLPASQGFYFQPWPPQLTSFLLLGLSVAFLSSVACLCLDSVPTSTALQYPLWEEGQPLTST